MGVPVEGCRLKEWVLSDMAAEDEDRILTLLPALTGAVGLWVREGIGAAMNEYNR